MKGRTHLVPIVLGTLLVLGIPPVLLVTATFSPEESLAAAAPPTPLRALIARQSNLELFYLGWQKGYLAGGGDRRVDISVAWTPSLSTEPNQARGRVYLDLIDGAVRAEVRGLDGRAADLWLVDNQEGPGMTVLPQPGDRMVRIGSLRTHGDAAVLSASLAPGSLRDFELDLVVVSPPGRTPAESRLLVGTRPYFERLYTRTRLAAVARREKDARLFGPAAMLATLSPRPAEADSAILVAHGLVSQAVGAGADLFFRGTFAGNGRTCGTCHRAANNLGLDTDFIAALPASDNLFIAELPPAAGGVPGLERPRLMRRHGQILMNVDGFENPTSKFTMRGVPHALSLATSIGNPPRTGWSGDVGSLRLLTNVAVSQHFTKTLNRAAGTDFVPPTDIELDDMEAFMLAAGRLNELNLRGVSLSNAAAQAGRNRFLSVGCTSCHFGVDATFPGGFNPNLNSGVERASDPSQATEPHPRDGGSGTATNPNQDCDGDGAPDCFGNGTFNIPPLIEAADTEPFFHNNSAATLEEAVTHYSTEAFGQAFFGRPLALSQQDILDIAAFLRVLNAAFNSAISIQRNTAALTLEKDGGAGTRETVNMLLALSNSEAADAVEVLSHRRLHAPSVKLLRNAIAKNGEAMAARTSGGRQVLIKKAINDLKAAKAKLGTALDFTLGEGNLLF
jgi:cytochrome c peroxidase